MTFRVGQPLVCVIKARQFLASAGEIVPEKDCVYTVRDLVDGGVYIRLNEIINKPYPYSDGVGECSFNAEAFRPAVERKTDISIFTRLLVPGSKVSEPV